MSTLTKIAENIAREAHAGQFRRDGVTPYITHVEAVVKKLNEDYRLAWCDDTIAAAWLHDVIDDTKETFESLKAKGVMTPKVDTALRYLTKKSGQSYDEYISMLCSTNIARSIKIYDILHNISDQPTNRQIRKYATALLRLVNEP